MDRTQRINDAYCRAVAARMDAGETERVLAKARTNLATMRRNATASPEVFAPWEAILTDPAAIRRVLTDDTPEAAAMRRNHPFAGTIPESERQQIVREAVRRESAAA
jgi:hypothetical protein